MVRYNEAMAIKELLREMAQRKASDLFYGTGSPARFKIDGSIVSLDSRLLTLDEVTKSVEELTTPKQREDLKNHWDIGFAFSLEETGIRFRVSVFMQKDGPSMVIRRVNSTVHSFEELNLPAGILKTLAMEKRGLVLLTGSMGSGKSTTIASMIEHINRNSRKHILTVEEPIEYAFKDKESLINQRELGIDVSSYPAALRAFTLQSPDVIFIGNICDLETMSSAIVAAETGVLVLSTLHTVNAAQSVERIINFFPVHQHQEVRNQLSVLLKGVISLRLLPLKNGAGRVPAFEIMLLTPTISRLIRENKIWEIPKFIEDGSVVGMQSFSQSLLKLVREGKVSEEQAIENSDNKDEFVQALRGIKRPRDKELHGFN
ncbi:MAG: PilT/PilU family type 4a pilus ATPase [Candidatus Omnitrophica bacterium]|nr:PilT/PilU family type 4a pilus ATPase [Candidatus Omnitrophota bacterium]MDE2214772.1 PilT/PilU family type 4a pilus ATPase [Candidatus Omnitrophota bacterium]MDE2231445.1 PilT/PilU family type 4a pilus ATPase [Candidatus Omnitrophota bacterium]